jgi:hypothetical protein
MESRSRRAGSRAATGASGRDGVAGSLATSGSLEMKRSRFKSCPCNQLPTVARRRIGSMSRSTCRKKAQAIGCGGGQPPRVDAPCLGAVILLEVLPRRLSPVSWAGGLVRLSGPSRARQRHNVSAPNLARAVQKQAPPQSRDPLSACLETAPPAMPPAGFDGLLPQRGP